jgi:hypothetical protein
MVGISVSDSASSRRCPPRVEAHGNDGVLVYAVLRIRHISKHLTMLRPGFGLSADGGALDAPCMLNHSSITVEIGPEATACSAA